MSSQSKSMSSSSEDDAELRRGPWTLEEDTLLIHYITRHGEGRWNLLAKRSGLKRTGKSCRLRWLNYLKPDVKRGNLSPEEQILILELHFKWGNRWSKIAQHLPGRTDNEIKNYWRTRVQKQARHLKIDANSTAFQEVIKCFYMPRLVQKIKGSSSPSSSSSSSVTHTRNSTLPHDRQALNYAPQNSLSSTPVLPLLPTKLYDHQAPGIMYETLQSLEQNSDSELCTSSGTCSAAESVNNNISHSQISQFSEYPTSPFHAMGTTSGYNPYVKDCYYVDNSSCYDLAAINMAATSAPGCYVADSNWAADDLADNLWNMDELWQFRNLQDRAT